MKQILPLFRAVVGLLLLLLGPAAWAQSPTWQTADILSQTSIGPAGSNLLGSQYLVADGQGNLYVYGYFYGTITLGATTLSTTPSAGGTARSGYVAKWNTTTRQFVWAVQPGSTDDQYITQVAVQGNNLYLAGTFRGPTINFGSSVLTNSASSTDGFVAKLVDQGSSASFAWAQGLGGSQNDYAQALAVNGANVYVSGSFTSPSASFGPLTLTNAVAAGGSHDIFVAKLADQGSSASFAWVQRAGGSGNDQGLRMTANGPNVYLTGTFTSPTLTFGNTTLTQATTNGNVSNSFVTKLTDNGSAGGFAWVMQEDMDSYGNTLAASDNNLYLVRSFSGTGVLGTTRYVSVGGSDLLVAKLTDAGTSASYAWVKQAGGTADEYGVGLAVQGNVVYVGGSFAGTTLPLGTIALTNAAAPTTDGYLAKLLDAGASASFTWADRFGGSSPDGGASVALTGGKAYVTCYVGGPATFGNLTLSGSGVPPTACLASLADATLATTGPASLSFGLYPNPARATATVQLPATTGSAPVTISVLDALGRTVGTHTLPAPTTERRHELALRGLPAGVYLVRITAGAASGTQRLAVQ